MKQKFPLPPVPPNADLRHFPSMPLNVIALLNSDTWNMADGWQAKAAVNLWVRAWHQVPAGSLPDNDSLLQSYAHVPDWNHCRDIALRGFKKHADGRLYHQMLCSQVLAALARSEKASRAVKSRWNQEKNTNVSAEKYERNTIDRRGEEKEKKERKKVDAHKRASRLPENWIPSAADVSFAAGRNLEGDSLRDEVAKFRNYWHAKAGRDSAKLDWPATWRTWVINWQSWSGKNGSYRNGSGEGQQLGFGAIAARIRRAGSNPDSV